MKKLSEAAGKAAGELRPVTIGYGEDHIDFSINRRKVVNGRALLRLKPDGPNDKRVKVLRIDDGQSVDPLAVLMHAACHPCVFTWGDKLSPPYPNGYPKISADFPGEAQRFVEKVYNGRTKAMFLQGCAGDIRPNLPGWSYRCGDEADIAGAAETWACCRVADRSVVREEREKRKTIYPSPLCHHQGHAPGKKGDLTTELQAMVVGNFLLTMPGEPMAEYGSSWRRRLPTGPPIIVGCEWRPGLHCTAASCKEGGYEPETRVEAGGRGDPARELERLADRAPADFEAIDRRPKK